MNRAEADFMNHAREIFTRRCEDPKKMYAWISIYVLSLKTNKTLKGIKTMCMELHRKGEAIYSGVKEAIRFTEIEGYVYRCDYFYKSRIPVRMRDESV
jgi:hypothetical protein